MSSDELEQATSVNSEDAAATPNPDELLTELELLREENQQLRESYIQAQRTQYKKTAAGLAGVGLLAIIGAVLFPVAQTVLLALGGTGLFAALLTYYLSPERFVSATVGAAVHESAASTQEALIEELGLDRTLVYVPMSGERTNVRLFIPQQRHGAVPPEDQLRSVFVISEAGTQRGVTATPAGLGLYDEFERALTGTPGDTAGDILSQLVDGLKSQFEIVDRIDYDIEADGGAVTLEVTGSAYGSLDRFDHPVVSFVAVGLAHGLGTAVTVDSIDAESGIVHLVWEPDDA